MIADAPRADAGPRDHVVLFYRREEELIETVGVYLVDALQSKSAAVVVATAAHRHVLEAWIGSQGVDTTAASAEGRLHFEDAEETLGRFLVDGRPDAGRFHDVIGALVGAAGRGERPVYVYGEMVGVLWQAGQINAAVAVESFWNDLGREWPFSLCCAYSVEEVAGPCGAGEAAAFAQVCGMHSAVLGTHPVRRLGRSATATTKVFPADARMPRAARHFVVETLRSLGSEEWLIDDAALVVTELTTNALMHAHSGATVNLWVNSDVVCMCVEDAAAVLPTQRPPHVLGPSGRGLTMVAALSRQWGADILDGGKVVWAELRR